MSRLTTPTRSTSPLQKRLNTAADELDQRYTMAPGLRRQINKVFPTHWSFLFGEMALYSFIILVLSGTYLALFYDPSMAEVTYHGSYPNMRGIEMSRAFATSLHLSFDIRGGLFVRQLHHWAALVFVAAIAVHMFRIFFTGAFRKPRETNWTIGILLLVLAGVDGFTGYSLPDDLLSGTGVRAALSGGMLSVPLIGTWLHWAFFGGEWATGQDVFIPRFYTIHIFIVPGLIAALIAVHLGLVWYQKHTQFPGAGKTENNVSGVRIMPVFALHGGSLFAVTFGVLSVMAGLFQINAIWNYGPYVAAQVSAGAQPDWYMGWTEGLLRLWPSWEVYLGNYMIPAPFFPLFIMGLVIGIMAAYPMLERKLTGDEAHHNLLQRPRDNPVRTSLGMMGIGFLLICTLMGGNDIIALFLHISLNATTWAGRIGLLVVPPIFYFITYRICLGLQRSDRAVLEHGIETGIIKRLPHGEYVEMHQPLGGSDEHGHAIPLEYQGAPVPKRMNKLGFAGKPVPGSLLRPDPKQETEQLTRAREEGSDFAETSSPMLARQPEAQSTPKKTPSKKDTQQ